MLSYAAPASASKKALLPGATSAPSLNPLFFLIALIVCFFVTCASSCAEDAGQLRLALDQTECASRNVNYAAGRRKCIDAVGIEHDELPLEVGP